METRCQTGQNFRGMKLSRMAADPRKPRKFNPAKVKAYTVVANGSKRIRQRMRNDLATHAERFGSTEADHVVSLPYCIHLRSRSIVNALKFTHVGKSVYSEGIIQVRKISLTLQ